MTESDPATKLDDHLPPPAGLPAPFRALLDLFSSIRFGVILLVILFFYSSLGSAGILYPTSFNIFSSWSQLNIRALPFFEMTEFEWFHWWPFDLLIALICINLVVATIRRVPFKPVNYGVWMIHTGIIILAIGSVIYFSTKVEGDAPVVRRQVRIEVPGFDPVTLSAIPGNRTLVGSGANMYGIEIASIDPQWELLSGDDKGRRAYKVTVLVQSTQQLFMRELLDGFPQYTEDLVPTGDPQQPMARAKRTLDKALVDENITLALEPFLQNEFFLRESWAVYLREQGTSNWVERPVHHMPRYNDYVANRNDVWFPAGAAALESPLSITVEPVAASDPLPDVPLTINSYLRYAVSEDRPLPDGEILNPSVAVRLANANGQQRDHVLYAFDPARNSAEGGRLEFRWINSDAELEALRFIRPPTLRVNVPGGSLIEFPVTETAAQRPEIEFTPVEGSDYAFRVRSIEDGLEIFGTIGSVAVVEIRKGEETFVRWVFDNPALTRDVSDANAADAMHAPVITLDAGIATTYTPGVRPALVTVIGGPAENQTRVLLAVQDQTRVDDVSIGRIHELGAGTFITLTRWMPRTRSETRPAIVPRNQRNKDADVQLSMAKVIVPFPGGSRAAWLAYHHYPFTHPNDTLRRFAFRPSQVQAPDGRIYELLLSRRRMPLGTSVRLRDFILTEHVGGFTGQTATIRDWTSEVEFLDRDNSWSAPTTVSVNKPAVFGEYSYFQSQWDPPSAARFEGDRPSAGLNYTVLGVGNRHGVNIQLFGCCVAVFGMIWAFYIKPFIKRRQQQAVYAALAEGRYAPPRREVAARDYATVPSSSSTTTNVEPQP